MTKQYLYKQKALKPMKRFLECKDLEMVIVEGETEGEARKNLQTPSPGFRWVLMGSKWEDNEGLHLEAGGEEVVLRGYKTSNTSKK